MQLDMFGATDESVTHEAAPPVVSAAGAWIPPEMLVFNAALHRGALNEAIGVLNRLKTDAASKVLLASGFSVRSSSNRINLMAGVQADILSASLLRMTGAELRAARAIVPAIVTPAISVDLPRVPANVEPILATVEDAVVDVAALRKLHCISVSAKRDFKAFYDGAQGKHPDEIDGDRYFSLSAVMSDANSALTKALDALPDDGFALHGQVGDRLLTINASAQRPGYWQVTRFDAKGEPWSDTQYETKKQGITDFLSDIDMETLDSIDGLFGGEQLPAAPEQEQKSSRVDIPAFDTVAPPAAPVVASKSIKDAGEELIHNRRNRIKTAKSWSDISHLNDALKVKEAVKANIWPKPDYKQLIADGMPPMVAHIVKQVYDGVAGKPAIGNRVVLDDDVLQKYIIGLNRVESGLMAWATDPKALQRWANENARFTGAMLGRSVSLNELAVESKTLLNSVYPDGYKSYRDEVIMSGGNKVLRALQPGYDDINRAIKAIKNGWPEKRESWEIQGFSVIAEPLVEVNTVKSSMSEIRFSLSINNRHIQLFDSMAAAQIVKAGVQPFALFGKRGFVDSFATEEEAIAFAKERSKREKATAVSDKGVSVQVVERVGSSHRMEGEDISSERLMSEFGLKGVNFGNWMKTPAARVEAQLHLNHAFDSFHDLAGILGLPPKAMSLGGMLGLAIGAQGGGGNAAAHFVPGVNEINLTRTSGAGSLAHEWAHAMDHYFATQGGLATSMKPFLTEHAHLKLMKNVHSIVDGVQVLSTEPRFGALRPEVVGAFKTITESMNKRLQNKEELVAERNVRLEKSKKNVTGWLKQIRLDYGSELHDAFDVLSARIQAGDVGDGKVALGRDSGISPVVAEMRDLYKTKHGRTYSIDTVKNLQSWIDSAAFQTSQLLSDTASAIRPEVLTDFSKNALILDKGKDGKYWSMTLEKFARSFDAFVSDELVAQQAKNGYLSHNGRSGETVPSGVEREAINTAFRGLVGQLKVKETEKGTVLFSAGIGEAEKTMPMAAIEMEIARLRKQWASMPNVTVVNAVSDLPFDAPWNTDGAYSAGQVWVVAGNVADLKQFQKVMAHECILHHSLEEMLGNYGFSKLHHGIQKLKASGDPVVGALAKNILSRYGELPPEIETKEIVARAGEQCLDANANISIKYGFMKSVFAGLAGWLRDHGLNIPFSNTELQGIMHGAGEWVKKDRGQEGQEPAYSADRLDGVVLNSFDGKGADMSSAERLSAYSLDQMDTPLNNQSARSNSLEESMKGQQRIVDLVAGDAWEKLGAVIPDDEIHKCLGGTRNNDTFQGKILDVDLKTGLVIQSLGRGRATVHNLRDFEKAPQVGQDASISYKSGKMQRPKDQGNERDHRCFVER